MRKNKDKKKKTKIQFCSLKMVNETLHVKMILYNSIGVNVYMCTSPYYYMYLFSFMYVFG